MEAYEAFGEMLVGSGFVADEAAAHEACRKLQRLLAGGGKDDASDVSSSTAATSTTAASSRQGFRALEGGPVLLDEVRAAACMSCVPWGGCSLCALCAMGRLQSKLRVGRAAACRRPAAWVRAGAAGRCQGFVVAAACRAAACWPERNGKRAAPAPPRPLPCFSAANR